MADKDPAEALANLPAALDAATAASKRWQTEHKGDVESQQADPYAGTVKHLKDLQGDLQKSAEASNKLAAEQGTSAEKAQLLGTGFADAADAADGNTDAVEKNKEMLKQYQDQLNSMNVVDSFVDAAKKVVENNQAAVDSFAGLVGAQNALNDARASGDPKKIADAEKDLTKAQDDAAKAAENRVKSYETLAQQQDKLLQSGADGIAQAQARLDDWVKRGVVPPDIAQGMQDAINLAKGVIDNAPPVELKAEAPQAVSIMAGIDGWIGKAHTAKIDTPTPNAAAAFAAVDGWVGKAHTARIDTPAPNAPAIFGMIDSWIGKPHNATVTTSAPNVGNTNAQIDNAARDRHSTIHVDVQQAFSKVGFGIPGAIGTTSAATAGVPCSTMAVPVAMAAPAPAPANITINVSAGIGDPAEIGRKVIDSIRAAERVQGKGWRVA